MKRVLSLLILMLIGTCSVKAAKNGLRKKWSPWSYDTTYYDSGELKSVTKSKMMEDSATTDIYILIRSEYKSGKLALKQKVRRMTGCYGSKDKIIWTRKRSH